MQEGRKILLYGISGNPPHGRRGHLGVIEKVIDTLSFDEVWILPVYIHIYQKQSWLESYEDRLRMCELNFIPSSTSNTHIRLNDE